MIENEQLQFSKALKLIKSPKQLSLIIEATDDEGSTSKYLYRPEKGLQLQIDKRIPIPYELYHNCAYSFICCLLDWNFAVPWSPYQIKDNDCGIIAPYYENATENQHYYYNSLPANDTWLKIAILDYITAVIDRTYNDILFLPNGEVKVTDSGLSFVEGINFTYQMSIVRTALKGTCIPKKYLNDLQLLNNNSLNITKGYIYQAQKAIPEILKRRDKLLMEKKII